MTDVIDPRDKALSRVRKLLARAGSSNKNEAELARQRAEELILKYGLTDAEIVVPREDQSQTKCSAGFVGDENDWRVVLALRVGKRYGCRVFRAYGRLFFDGKTAAEAVIAYRLAAAEGAKDRYRAPLAVFTLTGYLASFSSDRPGNYAVMFYRGRKLDPRGDVWSLDNELRAYTWTFDCGAVPERGARLVFATADRDAVGEVGDKGLVRLVSRSARVARDGRGEPQHVEDDGRGLGTVE